MKSERIRRTDGLGDPFEMGMGRAEDVASVLKMYSVFDPKPASQGLPPEDPETCRDWVTMLFQIGVNSLSWKDDRVVGHASLIPDRKVNSGELLIFVHQDHRNLGIATELTRFALEKFGEQGFEIVWLTVRMSNFLALKLYKKLGFEFCDMDSYERVMGIRLPL